LKILASIAQTLFDKQVKFQILSYKLGLGKSLTGLGLRKFKKSWAWACPTKFSTPASPPEIHYWMPFGQLVFLKVFHISIHNLKMVFQL
jgi:hypothetical protein